MGISGRVESQRYAWGIWKRMMDWSPEDETCPLCGGRVAVREVKVVLEVILATGIRQWVHRTVYACGGCVFEMGVVRPALISEIPIPGSAQTLP